MQRSRNDFGLWLSVGAAVWLSVMGLVAVGTVAWAPPDGVVAAVVAKAVPESSAAATAGTAPAHAAPRSAATSPAPAASSPPLPPLYEEVRDQVVAKLRATDPAQALALLEQIVTQRPEVAGICHPIAHDLGHAALEKYAYDFKKAISFQDGVCGNGYLHGVVERAVLHAPDPVAALHNLCAPDYRLSCLHGIGHGAMFVADMDLPKALAFCDWFRGDAARTSCAEGVFMQNFEVGVPGVKDSTWLKPSDPTYPCAAQPGRYQNPCYYYAPQYYLALHPAQYAAGLAWCRSAGGGGVSACTMGMGSRIMKYNISRVRFSEAQCLTVSDRGLRRQCVLGLTSYYMVHYNDPRAGLRLCPQLVDADDAATCRGAANAAVSSRD